jgi:hypothetical protein
MKKIGVKIKSWISSSLRPVHDPTGLLYLKFACAVAMIFIHTHYYLMLRDGEIATRNIIYNTFEKILAIGILPLILPATAGGMLIERLAPPGSRLGALPRLPLGSLKQTLRHSAVFMIIGLTLNWLLYRDLWAFHPYFQSTLEFLALAVIVVGVCATVHWSSLFFLVVGSLVITGLYAQIRFSGALWAKVLFASDGHQFLWPVFPWVGLVALGAALNWRKEFFLRAGVRRVVIPVALIAAGLLLYQFGLPLSFNPTNPWGEGVFQKDEAQGVTLMVIYFLLWNLSVWACARIPPPQYGIVHVLGQGIFYAYVANLASGFFGHRWLERFGHGECLALCEEQALPQCLQMEISFFYPAMFLFPWLVAWIACRYFMRLRIRVKLRPQQRKRWQVR